MIWGSQAFLKMEVYLEQFGYMNSFSTVDFMKDMDQIPSTKI